MRACEACGHRGALFAGAGSGPPVVRCARCLERLRPFRSVWLVQGGVSSPPAWVLALVEGQRVMREAAAVGEAWEQGAEVT